MGRTWRYVAVWLVTCAGCAPSAVQQDGPPTPAALEGIDNPCGSYEGAPCCLGTQLTPCWEPLTCVGESTCQLVNGLEKLPLTTLDLRVKTCNDRDWYHLGSYDQTLFQVGIYESTDAGAEPRTFWVNAPGELFRPDQVYTVGLRVSGVSRLGDIKGLELTVFNGDICVDSVELLVNDQVVFEHVYTDSPEYILGTYPPYHKGSLFIADDTLRQDQAQRDPAPHCGLPTSIHGGAFERAIAGAIGNALIGMHNDEILNAGFWDGDYVRTSKASDDTIHVDTRFHAFVKKYGFEAHVKVTLGFDLTVRCAPTAPTEEMPMPEGNALSLELSPISVNDVDGDIAVDIIVGLFVDNADIAGQIDAQVAPFKSSLQEVIKDLPVCPPLTVEDASPPGIAITYPDPFYLALLGYELPSSICQ